MQFLKCENKVKPQPQTGPVTIHLLRKCVSVSFIRTSQAGLASIITVPLHCKPMSATFVDKRPVPRRVVYYASTIISNCRVHKCIGSLIPMLVRYPSNNSRYLPQQGRRSSNSSRSVSQVMKSDGAAPVFHHTQTAYFTRFPYCIDLSSPSFSNFNTKLRIVA